MAHIATPTKIFRLLLLTACLWSAVAVGLAQEPAVPSLTAQRYLKILSQLGKHEYGQAYADTEALIVDEPGFSIAYEKLVDAAQRSGDIEKAQAFFTTQLAPPTKNLRAHFGLGLIWRDRGVQGAAIEEYKQCLRAFPEFLPAYTALIDASRAVNQLAEVEPFIQSLPQTSASRYALSYLRYKQRRYEEAIELSEQALLFDPHVSEAYAIKALSLYALGRYPDALQAAKMIDQEVTEAEKVEIRLHGLILKGVTTAIIGNPAQGIGELTLAYGGIVEVGNLTLEESVHSQLAYVYERQNDCAQSLYHHQSALAVAKQIKSPYVARHIGNIGGAYACLGDMSEAINYYRQALETYSNPSVQDEPNLVTLLINIARADLEDQTEALLLLQRALAVAKNITNKVMELRVRLALGAFYQRKGDHLAALEQTEAALKIAQEKVVPAQEGRAWNQLGRSYLSRSNVDLAIDAHRRALTIGERMQAPEIVWEALAGLGDVFRSQSRREKAAEQYRLAVETIEGARSRVGTAEDRASFLVNKIDVYKKLIGVLLQSPGLDKQTAEAFHYSERARARAFLDLLAEAKVKVEHDTAPDLLKQQGELQQQISQLTSQLISERSQETNKQDVAKIGAIEKRLGQADVEFADWLRELRRRNPRYAALQYPRPATLAETQRLLDDQTILLSYSLADPHSFLFAVTRTDFQVKPLPSETVVDQGVQKLLVSITDRNNPAPEEYRRQAARLTQQLLQPISSMLAGKKTLVIVPDGSLHRLPFAVLLLPGAAAQGDLRQLPYLIRRFAISYVPSASVLAELQKELHETAPKGFIAFGDPVYGQQAEGVLALRATSPTGRINLQPLPYSHTEIDGIARLFDKDDRELFFRETASEENVKTPERLARYRLVHFSTHGYVNEARPRFSGLVLSLPAANPQAATRSLPSEDGVLSAYEIFNLKLRADLVVLSACETGLGKEVKGEGLMSLTRAFMYAGAPSVVVSLWNVNDESAADLMIRFYTRLQNGRISKTEALRQAQLETISDNGFPFFWAPFVLVGKP